MTLAATTPAEIRTALLLGEEIALIDLREEAAFARGHPLFAAQISASRIELEILDKVPREATPIVLYDDGEGLVAPAALALAGLGYTAVSALSGGLAGWRAAEYELFGDVNSYSKAFGELVEARRHTPSLPAEEVQALIDVGADIAILDARRFEEYATMSIPGGTSVPGAELVLRAPVAAPNPETLVIVNCAGRTRSLIGAQSLINAGLPNRVAALRNGTIGWTLAGQTLDTGRDRRAPEADDSAIEAARDRAREVAYRAGVRHIGVPELARLERDGARTLYRFDVRTPEEYAAGHLPGFRSAPGGQLVQETDMFAPVRGARIVLADDLGSRADMTASWLAQMGWDVVVLEGLTGPLEAGPWRPTLPPLPDAPSIAPTLLADTAGLSIVDLAPSPVHRRGHVPGARFATRAALAAALAGSDLARVVLTSPDGALARIAAAELPGACALAGGTDGWREAGLPLETGLADPLTPAIDVYKRPYEGTDNAAQAMQAYLDWEFGLVAQLAHDGTHGFHVL